MLYDEGQVYHTASRATPAGAGGFGSGAAAPAQGKQAACSVHRGDVRLIDEFEPAWLELSAEASNDEPFYRPEWIRAYLRAFEPETSLVLLTVHQGTRLGAVLPLLRENTWFCGFPVRKLRSAANVHSCRFDLLRRRGAEGDHAVAAIWQSLKRLPDWDVIELRYAPGGCAAERVLALAEEDGFLTGWYGEYAVPYIPLNGVTDPLSFPHKSDFRRNLRRRMKRAEERGGLHVERFPGSDPKALLRFYELEASGWKKERGTAVVCAENTRRFYDQVSAMHGPDGGSVLHLMRFGEEVVAAALDLEYKKRFFALKLGLNEAYGAFAPGHLLTHGILQDILARGFWEFDFTGPLTQWTGEWTRKLRFHRTLYVFRKGPYGRALHFAKMRMMTVARELAHRFRT